MTRSINPRARARSPRAVRKQLRRLARWAVSAALTSAAQGCGDTDASDQRWTPLSCNHGRNVLFDPNFERDIDFAGFYFSTQRPVPPNPMPHFSVSELGVWGEPCRSALDAEVCQRNWMAAKMAEACRDAREHCGPFVVTTSGDDVNILVKRSEFLELLGGIDTASEAIALSAWDGDPIACADTPQHLSGTRARPVGDGWRVETEWEDCGVRLERYSVIVSAEGETSGRDSVSLGTSNCVIGRRPVGLCTVDHHGSPGSLGAFFATAAQLEAASVVAFERLARELTELRAPVALIAAAARSALDEVRHSVAVAEHARRFGAEPYPAEVASIAGRTPFEIALENAVEGCVRETYGALVGQHQALLALDPAVADVMRVIAADEMRHAELAWRVAAWLDPQLSAGHQLQLAAAKRQALTDLLVSARHSELPVGAARLIGLPSRAAAEQLVVSLSELVLLDA
ncbi:MAG TPA: ferritin-like domain-containing protein [Polyangiales bacterium]|nr:ferritin-like domain-containing protein [Polyangiales bacterium]